MRKERFEAFTDAVLAIILTILVLDIKLPSNSASLSSLTEVAPKFIAYVVTFIFIATIWVNHHFLFSQVSTINNKILWVNILALFWTSLLPATTAWLGDHIMSSTPAVLYSLNVLLFNITMLILRSLVVNENQITNHIGLNVNELISLGINTMTLIVAFWYPPFSFIGLSIDLIIWISLQFIHDTSRKNNR
ncbi:TMEM175 family protein [Lentilactobacillus sp. SPB1-3]|uniref:TMEM175 family protein n=1 Tax=Lentilactobacillus terminaliae TaxID=3003483 RepID=A0ACD5DDW2_9LACO|nr:TMEM175 family protein [Lentilactobacillus sp. SPB1-3]MCZ0977722.1 TMEM175 family protein [Lentilactobacillus sp. SPB1-3]